MIKTDSIKYQLLEMVGLCGEFPSGQLNRLIESDSYAEKVVTDLKQSKLIRTHYKDGLRGYRLTKRAKELLLSQNSCRFQNYLTGNAETNLIRSELPRRLRLHQKAETYLTLSHYFPGFQPWWLTAVAAVLLTICFSVVSWHLIEKPALALRNRF